MDRATKQAVIRAVGKRVGSRIESVRQARGWARARLAREAEISLTNLNLIERGQVSTTLATLAVIAKVLRVSAADLLDVEPLPRRQAAGTKIFEVLVDRLSTRDGRYLKGVRRLLDCLDEVMK